MLSKSELIQMLWEKELVINELRQENIKLKHLANTDELTGLFNKRAGLRLLTEEMRKAKALHSHLTVCFIDLDDFKCINDSFGHLVGDKLLLDISCLIKNCIRKSDIFFRFGGDEFIILFGQTNLIEAKKVMIRVNEEVEELNKRQSNMICSLSYGFSQYDFYKKMTLESVVNSANQEMYKEKCRKRRVYR